MTGKAKGQDVFIPGIPLILSDMHYEFMRLQFPVKLSYAMSINKSQDAPVCSPGQVTTYAVGREEDAEVTCSVQANPLQASFRWTFNNTADTIVVPQGRYTSSSSHSVITYTPKTDLDYGTLLCRASNVIGKQQEPCLFHIVPAGAGANLDDIVAAFEDVSLNANVNNICKPRWNKQPQENTVRRTPGKPDPPINCTATTRSTTSVRVRCESGDSGGLTQRFLLQARLQGTDTPHILNLTGSKPSFLVLVSSYNEKGNSAPSHLTLDNVGSTNSLYHNRDGPSEAEVRDGKNGANEGNGGGGGSVRASSGGNSDSKKYMGLLAMPSLIPAALGVGAGLILIIIVLILLLTLHTRRRRPHDHHQLHHHHHHHDHQREDTPVKEEQAGDTTTTATTTTTTTDPTTSLQHHISTFIDHHTSCIEREMQVDPESDADPDLIPLQEGSRPPDRLPLPATLLPPQHYKFAPVPSTAGTPYVREQPSCTTPPPCALHVSISPEHHHHHHHHHDPPRSATLPRKLPRPPSGHPRPAPSINPHLLPFSGVEGRLPPPEEYRTDSLVPKEALTREGGDSAGEEDTPKTPLLAKRESSV
ncbi:hypothetical protein Pmani_038343 [Petrolisthes manimaculis]|uniref:Ig-like domain-containing protein n=1 Tax=Petrolisthes manimaculis TaxID=1843537 RepID=A0AAE1TKB7_9EUCA|nr:hypothetical protein Pmani_038343 [Petrolisthes manimaculis]